MILVVLVLVPALVLAVAVVAVLDRVGVLPRLDAGPSSAASGGSWSERVPRAGLYGAGALMVAWILAWIVFLVVGISVLSG